MSVALDFNRSNLSDRPLNTLINQLIESAEPPSENYRQYLGASSVGSECLRKVQYDWMCDPQFPGRIKDIFERSTSAEANAGASGWEGDLRCSACGFYCAAQFTRYRCRSTAAVHSMKKPSLPKVRKIQRVHAEHCGRTELA